MKINEGTKDEIDIVGYKPDRNRKILTVILCILSAGLFLLVLSWKPEIRIKFTHVPCLPGEASVALITDIYKQVYEEKVERKMRVSFSKGKEQETYFYHKKVKYVWDMDCAMYSKLSFPPQGTSFSDLTRQSGGLTSATATERRDVYGENTINIEMPSVLTLFIKQAYNPFYIFQAYTIIIWCVQTYFIFSGCIFVLSVTSLVLNIWETRRQTKTLREKMVTQSKVQVLRDGYVKILDSKELVPGDIVLVMAGTDVLEADMVLLEGSAIVTEAILTGESVPLTKINIPENEHKFFNSGDVNRHMLSSGSQILQIRGTNQLKALVTCTGFNTVKGDMVRSILFPKPIDFQIYSDFLRLIFIFIVLGVAAMIWSLVHWSKMENAKVSTIIFNSIDLLTFVVPPIIPATVTAINLWAQKRLQKQKIFCISSNYINLAGPADLVCFDKTGTLTEDNLSLEGVVPSEEGEFHSPIKDLSSLPISSKFVQALATCHSVATEGNGNLIGHPLDIKLFTAIGWKIFSPESLEDQGVKPLFGVSKETNITGAEFHVYKMYPFESKEQRMTVLAKEISSKSFEVFIKGAPERIASMSLEYSVPDSFVDVLEWYTRQGLRIVAAAYKTLPATLTWEEVVNMDRSELESNSTFLGLIIMQNKLKPETAQALRVIHQAEITTVMITGDNLLTASNVARQCGLVKVNQQIIFVNAEFVPSSSVAAQHLNIKFTDSEQPVNIYDERKFKSVLNPNYVFGIDGESFKLISVYEKETLKKIVHRGRIFARMKPEQKIEVIEIQQKLGHQVIMCGDGCNDCGALKAAHVGISLSSTEASVAAPFTSLTHGISCVSTLIREGRASLISTYSSFKYNIAYSFAALIVVLFLFSIFTEPADMQYLIMDLVLITVPSLMMGNTGAASVLCKQRPTRRIVHPVHISSILSFLAFQTFLFWATWKYLWAQPWFEPFIAVEDTPHPVPSQESTVIIIQSCFSFVVGAVVYSHDFPFRKSLFSNKILTAYIIFSTILCIIFLFCQVDKFYDFLNFEPIPYSGFTWTVFLSVLLMAAICFIWERWFLYGIVVNRFVPWVEGLWGPRLPFEHLEKKMMADEKWPKLSEEIRRYSTASVNRELAIRQESNASAQWKPHGFYRKSTKKHKFTADVKFISEVNPTMLNRTQNDNYGEFKVRNSRTDQKGQPEELKMLIASKEDNALKEITPGAVEIRKNKGDYSSVGNEEYSNEFCQHTYESNKRKEHARDIASALTREISSQAGGMRASNTPPITPPPSPHHLLFSKRVSRDWEALDASKKSDNGSMVNLIRDMNTEWAKIRNSLHESMKELSLDRGSKGYSVEFITPQDNDQQERTTERDHL